MITIINPYQRMSLAEQYIELRYWLNALKYHSRTTQKGAANIQKRIELACCLKAYRNEFRAYLNKLKNRTALGGLI